MSNTIEAQDGVKVTKIVERCAGWDYEVHLSDGSRKSVYAQMQTWGVVWYQAGGCLQINREGQHTARFATNWIEMVLNYIAARHEKSRVASTCSC